MHSSACICCICNSLRNFKKKYYILFTECSKDSDCHCQSGWIPSCQASTFGNTCHCNQSNGMIQILKNMKLYILMHGASYNVGVIHVLLQKALAVVIICEKKPNYKIVLYEHNSSDYKFKQY